MSPLSPPDRDREKKAVREQRRWDKRQSLAVRFWRKYWKSHQASWFEAVCPRGLLGTCKRVNRARSKYDAHDPDEPLLVGTGATELGALFSLALQVAARVWWRMGGDVDRGPLPACLTRDGKMWRATSCRGVVRDFEGGEGLPTIGKLRFATGKTREEALSGLAGKLGVRLPQKMERTVESLKAERIESFRRQETVKSSVWDELEASAVERGDLS
jgi:hypothetical protein